MKSENLSGPQVPPVHLYSMVDGFCTRPSLRVTYSFLAPLYDHIVPYISSKARAQGRAWLDVEDGESVLDVGTGTGLALHPLAESNPHGWTEGVDASAAMLARARAQMQQCAHRRYGLRYAHATALPYPSDTFDAVFSSYLIDLLPASKHRSALREMRRVLRPKGRLVVVYLAFPQRPVEQLWAWIARAVPPLLGGSRPINPRPVLDTTGFDILRHTTCVQAGLRSGIVSATPQ